MFFLTGLLTVLLVLDCLFLILLVLVQLPKKDAGAGLAFGGGATDALFGAGSGNALTKITKYATIAFFALLMLITLIQGQSKSDDFRRALEQQTQSAPAGLPPASPAPAPAPGAAPVELTPPPGVPVTAPAAAATNAEPQ